MAQNAQQVILGDRGQEGGKGATRGWEAGRGSGKGARQHAGDRVGEKALIAKQMLAGKGWGQAEARVIRCRHTLPSIVPTLDCWRQCMCML